MKARSLTEMLYVQAHLALTVTTARRREGQLMNQYGRRAMKHWETFRPDAYQQLDNPQLYFTQMGETLATQISELATQIAGPDLPGEDYLDKVSRLNSARARATEIVMADSEAYADPELDREEWEATTQLHKDSLIDWAMKMGEQIDEVAFHDLSYERAAADYQLPMWFLEGIAASDRPWAYLKTHSSTWDQSVEKRWKRDKTRPPLDQ